MEEMKELAIVLIARLGLLFLGLLALFAVSALFGVDNLLPTDCWAALFGALIWIFAFAFFRTPEQKAVPPWRQWTALAITLCLIIFAIKHGKFFDYTNDYLVAICPSDPAYAYHAEETCDELLPCYNSVIYVSVSYAVNTDKRPCKVCLH